MSDTRHPFIDPDDTDWGRLQNQRHQENQERFSRIERGLGSLWEKMDEADRKRDAAREETREKMQFLESIQKDLQQAIQLFRGAKLTAYIIGWLSGLAGAVVAIWQFLWPKK